VRLFVGILCGVVLLSAVGMIVASLFLVDKPVWVVFGFETVIAIACALGILFALGRFQDGQGLALACVAGTIFVGSFLGWLGTQHHLTTSRGNIPLNTWLLGRVGAAAVLGFVGALLVLSRNPRSWSYVARAAVTGGPVVALLGVYVLRPSAVSGALSRLPGWAVGIMGTLGALVAVALISASVHCLIRAFELGRTEARS
jgi:hypothetical protein